MRVILIAVLASIACHAQLNVVYTGRMFGYLRFPDSQSPAMQQCEPDVTKMTGQAKGFYEVLKSQRPAEALTVGMGDNFGPDLFAKSFDGVPAGTPPSQSVPHPGKDLYAWDFLAATPQWVTNAAISPPLEQELRRHHGVLPADNVGCFIRAAAYDAIVPGKHDFEMGPEHLIMLAKFLVSDHHGMPKTAMLGANIAISTNAPDAKPRVPLYQIEADFQGIEAQRARLNLPRYSVLFPPQDGTVPTPVLPATVFPWLREIDVQHAFYLCVAGSAGCGTQVHIADLRGRWDLLDAATKSTANLSLTAAAAAQTVLNVVPRKAAGDPSAARPQPDVTVTSRIGRVQLCRNATRDPYGFLHEQQPDCTDLREKPNSDAQSHASESVTFLLGGPVLQPDFNYAICVEILQNPRSPRFSCQPFYVVTPFFAADPFFVKPVGKESVAVFGLLDPDLQNRIGRLNNAWRNADDRYETSLKVVDPVVALTQVMMRCAEAPACRDATRRVLLAQMPAYKATQLLALHKMDTVFDLVVAETDAANKTGAATVERTLPDSGDGPHFVVTPDDLHATGKVIYNVQLATVQHTLPGTDGKVKWTLTNRMPDPANVPGGVLESALPPPHAGHPSLREAAEQALVAMGVPAPFASWSDAEILQRLALLVMQRDQPADISMLQTRDFFEPQLFGPAQVTGQNLQELLDRIFWKNDFAVRVPATGATVTAVLAASAVFATQDADPLNADPERGRSIVSLGAFKESAEANLTVSGALIDPNRLYSITLTDFLAMGDTGYSSFQTPAVPPAFRIKSFPHLHSIAGTVCAAIRKAVPGLADAKCLAEPLPAKEYLDSSNQQPPDTTPGLVAMRQTRAYLDPRLRLARFRRFYDGQNAAERLSAQKPYWSFTMEKGDFSLNFNRHKKFDGDQLQTKSLQNQFSGVQIAAVTAPNSYAFSFDDRSRLKRSSQRYDFYVLDDLAFSYTRTQNTADNNFTRNLSLNLASLEVGELRHLHPGMRSPRTWDLVLAGRLDSQVTNPREDIGIAAQTSCPSSPCGAGGTLRGAIRRAADLYLKTGLRYSDPRSWVEFGLINGGSLQVPYALQFDNGQPPPNNRLYLEPGFSGNTACAVGAPAGGCQVPDNHRAQDWNAYLSYYGYITPQTKFTGIYQTRPLNGIFLNFSFNTPLPFGNRYAGWAGGKGIAFLAENSGRLLFNRAGDLAAQTRYLDKLALSVVIPVVGNFSLKPEVDLLYFRSKISNLPFHSIDYLTTFSYTFDWRQGQSWWRAMRFATPAPSSSVPAGGR